MRFTIEQHHITDAAGRAVASAAAAVSFHSAEAESASDAIHQFAGENHGQIIGEIRKFPGLQAMATLRHADGVYTLQVAPSSQAIPPFG